MSTWNDKCRVAAFIAELKSRDPLAFDVETFLISGLQLKPEIRCSLGTCCSLEPKADKER